MSGRIKWCGKRPDSMLPWGNASHHIQASDPGDPIKYRWLLTPNDYSHAVDCVNACADINPAAVPVMVEALRDLLKQYRALVDSGDCGCWDSLDDDEVVNAIAALQLAGVTP